MTTELKPLFKKVENSKVVNNTTHNIVKKEEINPQDRKYIILYYATVDDGEEIKSFEEVVGREAMYEFIKNMVECLDIHRSIVLTDNVPYKNAISVYEFMKYIKRYFENDSFDIEDYNIGDI